MPRLFFPVLLAPVLVALAPCSAAAGMPSLEMRVSPPLLRPNRTPSLGVIVAAPLTQHLWLGGGYELISDYDAILWYSAREGHKPIVMSGARAGAWYRDGAVDQGMTWAAGGLVTFSSSVISISRKPDKLDHGTFVVDLGPDLCFGYVRRGLRVELFTTPAWSYGRVASKPIHSTESLSTFTYRVGVAFSILLGT